MSESEGGSAASSTRQWGDPGTYLILWDCGDEECSCYQVHLNTRGPKNGFPCFLIKSEEISEFHSQPEREDWLEMRRAFERAIVDRKPDFVQPQDWPYADASKTPKENP